MNIKSQLKKIKDCRHELKIEVPQEFVDERFEQVYASFSSQAKLPGFRKGKVPKEMVESTYVGEATEEVLKTLAPEAYSEALAKHKIQAMSMPQIGNVNLKRGQKLQFTAQFDVAPQVKIRKYKGFKVNRPSTQVSDEEIVKTLESFRQSRGTVEPVNEDRPVQEGDILSCDIEMWQGGSKKHAQEGFQLGVKKDAANAEFIDAVIGMKKDQTKDIKLPGKDENKDAEPIEYKITVREIKKQALPELDDAFAKGFGKDTLELFKEEIRKDMGRYKEHQSRQSMKDQVCRSLIQENAFAVPLSMVQKHAVRIVEDKIHQDHSHEHPGEEEKSKLVDEVRPKAEEQVRLYFILDKLADELKVQADQADVERRIQEIAQARGEAGDEVRKRWEDDIRHELRQNKVIDQILAEARITDEGDKQ